MRFDMTLCAAAILAAAFAHGATAQTINPPAIPTEEAEAPAAPETDDAVEEGSATPPPPPPAEEEEEEVAPPPPPEPEPEPEYFTSSNGTTEGPFPLSELQAQVSAGTMSDQTYVWQDGMADWARAGEVDELASLFASGPTEGSDADLDSFLVGIWADRNSTFVAGIGQVQMDMLIEYYSDGRMDAVGQMYGNVNGQAMAWDIYAEGTWRAVPISENTFDIVTDVEIAMGLVESPVYTDFFDAQETTRMEQVNANTMRDVQNDLTFNRVQ